jgi:hypothetical protein
MANGKAGRSGSRIFLPFEVRLIAKGRPFQRGLPFKVGRPASAGEPRDSYRCMELLLDDGLVFCGLVFCMLPAEPVPVVSRFGIRFLACCCFGG